MRKITRLAALAFRAGKPFTMDNTSVTVTTDSDDKTKIVAMFLHGHRVAERNTFHDGISRVHVTLAGWGTPTTRERVNGLLDMLGANAGYYQRNHEQHFFAGEQPCQVVSASDWQDVETRC